MIFTSLQLPTLFPSTDIAYLSSTLVGICYLALIIDTPVVVFFFFICEPVQ